MAKQFNPNEWRSCGGSKCGRANYTSKEWRRRNRPISKQSASELRAWLEAPHRIRIREESDAIRARKGLEPVPENEIVRGARARLAELEAAKPAKVVSIRKEQLSPIDALQDIARRRQKLERERLALDSQIRELAQAGDVPISRIAAILKLSRQRVYQLAS